MKIYKYIGRSVVIIMIIIAIRLNFAIADKYSDDPFKSALYAMPAGIILTWLILGKMNNK